MKKLNTKVVTLAIIILSLLAVGGVGIKQAVSPSGFGQGDAGTGGGG
ncbi:MAG: hypothetical protein HZR80_14075 [Candidatus Heimdallarchaeota archaeon]